MLQMLYLGYLLSQQHKIFGWASSSVSIYDYETDRGL